MGWGWGSLLCETSGMLFVGSDLHNDSSGRQKKQRVSHYNQPSVDVPGLLLFKGVSVLILIIEVKAPKT